MTEKRKIDDDELVEITGGGEFEVSEQGIRDSRPTPPPGGGFQTPETDNEPDGDQDFGE